MTIATQIGNAPQMSEDPLLQSGMVAPAQAPAGQQESSNPETQPFDAELQALLSTLAGASVDEPVSTASVAQAMPAAEADSGEQGLEQAEALLGLLSAQQQQQVQALQVTPASAGRASAPGEMLGQAEMIARHASTVPSQQVPETAQPNPAQALPAPPRSDTAGSPPALRAEAPLVLGVGEIQGSLESLHASAAARPITDSAPMHAASSTTAPASTVAERLVRLEGNDAQRGEQMLQALRNNVQLQLQQNQQVATIRLDPPELGSLEIQVTQESGKISVQISAAQADTLRLLQQTSDRLRHELLTQQFVQVNVQVGGDGRSGQQSRQNQEGSSEVMVRGNPLNDSGDASSRTAPRDVLATV